MTLETLGSRANGECWKNTHHFSKLNAHFGKRFGEDEVRRGLGQFFLDAKFYPGSSEGEMLDVIVFEVITYVSEIHYTDAPLHGIHLHPDGVHMTLSYAPFNPLQEEVRAGIIVKVFFKNPRPIGKARFYAPIVNFNENHEYPNPDLMPIVASDDGRTTTAFIQRSRTPARLPLLRPASRIMR